MRSQRPFSACGHTQSAAAADTAIASCTRRRFNAPSGQSAPAPTLPYPRTVTAESEEKGSRASIARSTFLTCDRPAAAADRRLRTFSRIGNSARPGVRAPRNPRGGLPQSRSLPRMLLRRDRIREVALSLCARHGVRCSHFIARPSVPRGGIDDRCRPIKGCRTRASVGLDGRLSAC